MKSIKCIGMPFAHGHVDQRENVYFGLITGSGAASVWKPTLKERFQILFGRNIMMVFPTFQHDKRAYLRTSIHKEVAHAKAPRAIVEVTQEEMKQAIEDVGERNEG